MCVLTVKTRFLNSSSLFEWGFFFSDRGINSPQIQPAVRRMRMRMRVCEEFWDAAVIRSEAVSRLRRTHRCFQSVNLIILPGLFLHLLSFPLVFPVLLLEGMKCTLIFLRSIMSRATVQSVLFILLLAGLFLRRAATCKCNASATLLCQRRAGGMNEKLVM